MTMQQFAALLGGWPSVVVFALCSAVGFLTVVAVLFDPINKGATWPRKIR